VGLQITPGTIVGTFLDVVAAWFFGATCILSIFLPRFSTTFPYIHEGRFLRVYFDFRLRFVVKDCPCRHPASGFGFYETTSTSIFGRRTLGRKRALAACCALVSRIKCTTPCGTCQVAAQLAGLDRQTRDRQTDRQTDTRPMHRHLRLDAAGVRPRSYHRSSIAVSFHLNSSGLTSFHLVLIVLIGHMQPLSSDEIRSDQTTIHQLT